MPKIFHKLWFTIVSACLVNVCFAQSPIQVKSFEDLRPLPYASVINLTKRQLHFSDEYGIVSANFEIGDSIFISYVGYQNMKSRIALAGSQTYYLKQSNAVLEPVQIVKCKNVVKHEYSNLISDTSKRKFGGVGWNKRAMNAKVAVMLRPGFDDVSMNAFSIWLKRGMGAPKNAIQAPMIFSFYNIDDSSMLPGELISNQQVIYYPKKEGRQSIRINSLSIRIPKPGIYVCIEYILNDKYQWPMRYVDKKNGIDSIYMQHGGLIDGVYSKDFMLAFYNYESNSWFFAMHRDKSTLLEVHGTIKFSAEITSCKEEKR